MKQAFLISFILLLLLILVPVVSAHSGRTDSNGGHNCSAASISKGLCTGYHYHNGGSAPAVQPVAAPEVVTPVTTSIPVIITPKPTIKPTTKPTAKTSPSPTLTPSFSPSLLPSPTNEIKQIKSQQKKSGGFFEWFFNLFR
jgi:hypothetical protein